jgi:hypothetical protein
MKTIAIIEMDSDGLQANVHELPNEIYMKLAKLAENHRDMTICELAADIIDDAVDVWLEKEDE